MNLSVISRFLGGNAAAIREIANNRAAFATGIVLVLITGIARNYDQSYFADSPLWLFGPLLFSFFSGTFLYLILIRGFARRHLAEDSRPEKQWLSFMGLFWMTAPIAWLYAIPVERFFNSYFAAVANIVLLAIVSAWRVALMSRIMSVLLKIPFLRGLGWVLLAASLEIIMVVFFGTDVLGRLVFAGMAGMRNSPEQNLMLAVFGNVWVSAWVVACICIAALGTWRFRGTVPPLPKPLPNKMPWRLLAVLAVIWMALAIQPQIEEYRFLKHRKLVEQGQFSDAVAYLAQYERADFPPGRRFEPDPFEYRVWSELPPTIASLNSNTPPWIREVYLSHLTETLSHWNNRYKSWADVWKMVQSLSELPEGREWLLKNQEKLANAGIAPRNATRPETEAESTAWTNILTTLRKIGISETNLIQLEGD